MGQAKKGRVRIQAHGNETIVIEPGGRRRVFRHPKQAEALVRQLLRQGHTVDRQQWSWLWGAARMPGGVMRRSPPKRKR